MKVRENEKPSAQHSLFLKMFKQLRLEIGLKDALVEMPNQTNVLSSLLRNKEEAEEIASTTVTINHLFDEMKEDVEIKNSNVSDEPVLLNTPLSDKVECFALKDDIDENRCFFYAIEVVENDESEDGDHELPNLDHQDDPSIPRPPPEPPDVEKCFEPEAGILITKVFKGVSKSHDFMTNILPTHTTHVSDLTFILFGYFITSFE
ncbi:hypothetical protein Tco_0916791 [Tanacetum coccineum]